MAGNSDEMVSGPHFEISLMGGGGGSFPCEPGSNFLLFYALYLE